MPPTHHRIHFVIDIHTTRSYLELTHHALYWLEQLAQQLDGQPGLHDPDPIRIEINGHQHLAHHQQP
jgi:hypothetical protein